MAPSLLKSRKRMVPGQLSNSNPLYFTEFVAFCPHCKNMETIWLGKDSLQTERRYNQHNGLIYHDCGATEPCRLYGPR